MCLCTFITCILLIVTHVSDGQKFSRNQVLKIDRRVDGDIISERNGDHYNDCDSIKNAGKGLIPGNPCKCDPDTPTFNAFSSTSYGCYDFQKFCVMEGCIDIGIATVSTERFEFSIKGNENSKNFIFNALTSLGSCNYLVHGKKNIMIWNHTTWKSFSNNTALGITWIQDTITIVFPSVGAFNGKLLRFQYWCTSPNSVAPRNFNYMILKVFGQEYFTVEVTETEPPTTQTESSETTSNTIPANTDTTTTKTRSTTIQTTATTTTTITTTNSSALDSNNSKKSDTNVEAIVIPTIAVLLLIILLTLFIFWYRNKKSRRTKNNNESHSTEIPPEERQQSTKPRPNEAAVENDNNHENEEPLYYETEPIYYVSGEEIAEQEDSIQVNSREPDDDTSNYPDMDLNVNSTDEYAVVDKSMKTKCKDSDNDDVYEGIPLQWKSPSAPMQCEVHNQGSNSENNSIKYNDEVDGYDYVDDGTINALPTINSDYEVIKHV